MSTRWLIDVVYSLCGGDVLRGEDGNGFCDLAIRLLSPLASVCSVI